MSGGTYFTSTHTNQLYTGIYSSALFIEVNVHVPIQTRVFAFHPALLFFVPVHALYVVSILILVYTYMYVHTFIYSYIQSIVLGDKQFELHNNKSTYKHLIK